MTSFPTTQISLLGKLSDRNDREAWSTFVSLYRPAIYRFARRRGLQEADAQDLTQAVLSAVVEQINNWQPDPELAQFRSWLSRIALNQTITMYRRRRADQAIGGTSAINLLAAQADEHDDSEELLNQYRREAFRYAARIVRQQVEETSWQSFWLTAVDSIPVADVAKSLGLSVGAVYTARSRVMRRLVLAVQELEARDDTLSSLSSASLADMSSNKSSPKERDQNEN